MVTIATESSCIFGAVPLDIDKIKTLRTALGLSQQEAAERAGIGGKQNWYAIESGDRANLTLEVLERIATVLKTTAKDLLK